jgi:hypothetical protein
MVDVTRVDVRPMIEEVSRDLDRKGKVERRLAVAPSRVHEFGIALDELFEPVHQSEPSGGVNIDNSAALDDVMSQIGIGRVQESKSARPPPALGVDVRACVEKHIEHLAASRSKEEWRIEGAKRLVELRPQLGLGVEKPTGTPGIIILHCLPELVQTGSFGRWLLH